MQSIEWNERTNEGTSHQANEVIVYIVTLFKKEKTHG